MSAAPLPGFIDLRVLDTNVRADRFTFSNNNRTATKVITNGWDTLTSIAKFESGTVSVHFVIDAAPNGNLMIGFTPADADTKQMEHPGAAYNAPGAALYSSNGCRYQAGSNAPYPGCPTNWAAGTSVIMVINFVEGVVSFNINGVDRKAFATNVKGPLRFMACIQSPGIQITVAEVRYEPVQLSAQEQAVQPPANLTNAAARAELHKECLDELDACTLPLRILVHGHSGAGKSRLLNTLITAVSRSSRIREDVPSNSGACHVTKRLNAWKILCKLVPLQILDSWGWTATNYPDGIMNYILNGNVAPNFRMSDKLSSQENPLFRSAPTAHDAIDAVIQVVSSKEILANPEFIRGRLAKFSQECFEDHGINVVYVITHIDELEGCAELARDPSRAYEFAKVREAILAVCRWTGVASNRVVPCKLYHGEHKSSTEVETMPLYALMLAVLEGSRRHRLRIPQEGTQP